MFLVLLIVFPFVQVISCIKTECKELEYCGECVANVSCAWCLADDFKGSRCGDYKYMQRECKNNLYPNEELEEIDIINDYPFGVDKNKIIQLKPQRIKIRTRPGKENYIDVSYKPAKDYPLDIYYLVDNSYTMKVHKDKLASEGKNIIKMLEALTNNILLGFGTFVEKPELPYAKKISNAYSFQNHLSLTNDTTLFTDIVSKIGVEGNLDTPEAMFDGLMQTMVCKDELGWRDDSLKIIISCTDAPYHSAGEGKFVGAFQPNDMKCHLKNHTYIEALTYDYPSVSQINKIANEMGYTIIFAASEMVDHVYEHLIKTVKHSIYAELKEQTNNKSNVIDIVKEQYTKLVQKIKLETNITDDIKLQLFPNCIDKDTNACGIKYKETKIFKLAVKIKSCIRVSHFEISTQTNDKLLLDIEAICSCPCENTNDKVQNYLKCSSNGIFQCGICKCFDNRYGDNCQCDDASSDNNDKTYMEKCKVDTNNTELCSGRGICSCGKCVHCEKGFSGSFCEYDEKRCLNTKNEMCSNNGECIKGICNCNEDSGWSGEYCNCQDKSCIAPYSDQICSGRGNCDCGKCVCNNDKGNSKSYIGEYCDYCENCQESRCRHNKYLTENCKTGNHNTVVCNNSTDEIIFMANKNDMAKYENAHWCTLSTVEDECLVVYKTYVGTDKKVVLIVQQEKDCPGKTNIWILIGTTIGSILLVGLLTAIVWKILVDLHDKKEYEKFKRETAKAGWDASQNPLYIAPDVNFINPCFEPSAS